MMGTRFKRDIGRCPICRESCLSKATVSAWGAHHHSSPLPDNPAIPDDNTANSRVRRSTSFTPLGQHQRRAHPAAVFDKWGGRSVTDFFFDKIAEITGFGKVTVDRGITDISHIIEA